MPKFDTILANNELNATLNLQIIRSKSMNFLKKLTPFTLPFLLAACGNDDLDPNDIQSPDTYEFTSITDPSATSSVDYREATTRLTLIKELEYLIESDELQAFGQETKSKEAVIALLNRVYDGGTQLSYSNNLMDVNLYDEASPAPTQVKGINVNDNTLTFTDNSLAENINLKDALSLNANLQIQNWFISIALLAIDDDDTTRFSSFGYDYQALIIGYLSVVMPFDQVSNHLLSTNNLGASNARDDSTTPYTLLEHNWDLAFGYFGTSTSAKIKSLDAITNGQENSVSHINYYVFDFAAETAQRDLQSTLREANFSQSLIELFLDGRTTISLNETHDSFSNQSTLITNYAADILYHWERALAATLIYHTKNTITNRYSADEYNYHWAMMTIYAQAIAIYPNSAITDDLLTSLTKDKVDPTTNLASQTTYLGTLVDAERDTKDIYGFSSSDVSSWQ